MAEEKRWTPCGYCNGSVFIDIGEKQLKAAHTVPVCAKFVELSKLEGVQRSLGVENIETGKREEISGLWQKPG